MNTMRLGFLFLVSPLALGLACGERSGSGERESMSDRELELAIRRDTPAVALADTPVRLEPKREARPPTPASMPSAKPQARAPVVTPPVPPAPPSIPEPATATVAAGTTFDVLLDREISTRSHRPGDRFTAKLAADVASPDGKVLIPAGAAVEGEVTAAQASKEAGQQATITLAFQTLAVEGRTYPLRASVVAAEVKSQRTTSDAEQAAKIVGGAAAGAVLGKVLGKDAKAVIIGAAAGAAAGTAIALGTADYAGVIPAGGKLTLKLDEPLEVVIP